MKKILLSVLSLGLLLQFGCSKLGDSRLYPKYVAPQTEIEDWCPMHDDEDVMLASPIWIRFSQPLDASTVNMYTIMLGSGREHIRGAITYDPNTYTVYYKPYEGLRPNTAYDVYVTEDLLDIYGRKVLEHFQYVSFKTGNPGSVLCPQNPFDPVIGRPSEEEEGEGEWELGGDMDQN